jgi:hypothetical protein
VFSLLFTPLGRYAAIAAVVLSVLFGAYLKIKSDAVAEVEVKATEDVLRRTENAINAGDAVDVSADGVRKPDAYTRHE